MLREATPGKTEYQVKYFRNFHEIIFLFSGYFLNLH
jgi:hypothetical protein